MKMSELFQQLLASAGAEALDKTSPEVTLHLTDGQIISGMLTDCEDEFLTLTVQQGSKEKEFFVAVAHIVYWTRV
jgi:hypothetical protein